MTAALPQRLRHTIELKCPFDRDYAKWRLALAGKGFDQSDLVFADNSSVIQSNIKKSGLAFLPAI